MIGCSCFILDYNLDKRKPIFRSYLGASPVSIYTDQVRLGEVDGWREEGSIGGGVVTLIIRQEILPADVTYRYQYLV